jgi:hypothetical protein
MLDRNFVEQPQMKEQVQNNLEDKMQVIGLGKG